MVDLRARNKPVQEEQPQDIHALERLTPPSTDLMAALKEHFAIYLPDQAPAGIVADLIAEQRGAWRVINYMQQILDQQTQERS